jgi:hypothetical protein
MSFTYRQLLQIIEGCGIFTQDSSSYETEISEEDTFVHTVKENPLENLSKKFIIQ